MLAHAALILLCILWMLLCWRFYTLVAVENVWQRRSLAIAAGLGAGLIYLLGSMLMPFLRPAMEPPRTLAPQDIRVHTRP